MGLNNQGYKWGNHTYNYMQVLKALIPVAIKSHGPPSHVGTLVTRLVFVFFGGGILYFN